MRIAIRALHAVSASSLLSLPVAQVRLPITVLGMAPGR